MAGEEGARQRYRRPRRGSVQTLHSKTKVGAVEYCSYGRRVPHPIAAVLCFLLAGILVSPIFDDVARTRGVGLGVLAAPCGTRNTTARGPTTVTPKTGLNHNMFNCEGGDFEISWSGVVNITETIYIGQGTTVHITGDSSPNGTSDTAPITRGSSPTNFTDIGGVEDLYSLLSIPHGLTSAAVRVVSSDISAADNDSMSLGPIFYVDGGDLFIEKMAIRGGYVANSTKYSTASGAGIYAQQSNVTVTSCEFEDSFAEFDGGGIFANASTLTVISSVFRRCRAGFRPQAGGEAFEGGGGINSNATDTLILGCMFEECYASKKGGGMRLGDGGKMSILKSVFYNNSAGSDNVKDGELSLSRNIWTTLPRLGAEMADDGSRNALAIGLTEADGAERFEAIAVGEAGALSIGTCDRSFDGFGGCSINDTVFAYNHAARKGGAFNIGTGSSPSNVELHRCMVANSTAGIFIEDDPQGQGGAFNLATGHRLLLSDSVFIDSYCGNKGGVIHLSSGDDWEITPGATVILRNSTFHSNTADGGDAGVVSLSDYTTLVVAGDENLFQRNKCDGDGAVFGGMTNTNITVEGGVFRDNYADGDGGVIWTKGTIQVRGGRFLDNIARNVGGVVILGDESTMILAGGEFKGNQASDGGVMVVGSDANLSVSEGRFIDNKASNSGGAFFVGKDGTLKITGGVFSKNKADFGGFLYKKEEGSVFCVGALIEKSKGVDGGAIYAVGGAVLHWACELKENSALAGPGIYARDNTTVILTGMSLVDNEVARGAVVFVADSYLETYQVEFKDTTKSSDLSAVQVDQNSSYTAEDTSFVGFQGEAVVFSEGTLFLDDCDFNGSTASQLVYTEPDSTVVIRNTVLGDNNYLALAEASSQGGKLPTADSLINANLTCQDAINGGDTSSADSSEANTICSEGHECLEGDLGVYCECYLQRSTMEQRCTSRDAAVLDLNLERATKPTFFPDMLEGDLILTHIIAAASSSMASTSETEASLSKDGSVSNSGHGQEIGPIIHGGNRSGVIWKVSALPQLSDTGTSTMNWTIFPSSGLLLPGKSVTLRVVTLPSPGFDGSTFVNFSASGMGSSAVSSESLNVTFFHCEIGHVWNATAARLDSSDRDSNEACQLCIDVVGEDTRGVNCNEPGATIEALPIVKGHWRAGRDVVVIRECANEDACKGGTIVKDVQEYCNDGYKGPECSVCASGYGRGTASQCHRCTESFKTGMLSILAILALLALVMTALLVVYLIGGGEAVSSTVSSTKQSVRTIKRRGSVLLARSEGGGVIDFNTHYGLNSTNSGDIPGDKVELAQGIQTKKSSVRGTGSGSTTHSVPGIDPASISSGRNLVGGSGRALLAGRVLPKNSSFTGRAASVRPHSPTPKPAGGAFITPMRVRGSPAPSTALEPKSSQTVPDPSSHGETADATGGTAHHHANSSGIPGQHWTSELQHGYGTPPATEVGLEHSTGNIWQSQPSQERTDVEWSVRNGAQPQSPEGNRAENGEGDNTAAAKIGNMLMELPLSKVKIVIVVWQISAAFTNITNVGYPPIYEKFLSIIGIFSLDLAWILSAACLTTEVNFYYKLLMVTIGPLIVLGLLGATFHIGVRKIRPVASNLPIRPQAGSRSQSDTNVLQMAERLGSDPVLHRENISDSPSCQDVSHVMELPRFGPVLQRGGHSGGSGDTMTLSRSEHPTTIASYFAGQPRSADGDRESLGGGTANHEDSATEPTCGLVRPSTSLVSEDISLGETQPSLGSVAGAGTGNQANPEEDRLGGLFARHTTMTLILLYLVYSQVSTVVFQTFSCEAFPEINKSFLRADLSIQCDTDMHKAYKIYAAVMIFLWPLILALVLLCVVALFRHPLHALADPLGIPAAFYFLLSRQRSSINPPTDKVVKELRGTQHVVREKIKQRSTDRSIAPTSFLWNAYYPNRYYYEVFECLRRLVLTGLLVFLVPDTSGQVAFSCVFAFASLLAFELQRPHIDSLEIQIYRTGCLVIFFTNFLALMIKAEVADENSAGSAIYSVALIMVNVMFFLSIWWNTWAGIKLMFTRRGFQGAMMGVDVVGEDTVDTFLGPNKKERQTTSLVQGAEVNSSPEEERPAWDNTHV